MKTILATTGIALITLCANVANGAVISAWDFAGLPAAPNTPSIIAATVGTGSLDTSAFSSSQKDSLQGTALNAFTGAESAPGSSLAIENQSANGLSMVFTLDMSGHTALALSFATQGTATGFNSHAWAYSNNGIDFTTLDGINTAVNTSFQVKDVDFSGAASLNGDSLIFIRLTLDGATSASGNNRFDNIQFDASPVPEPAEWGLICAVGLLGVCGLHTWRERRRSQRQLD
jgi:hypothetical protein